MPIITTIPIITTFPIKTIISTISEVTNMVLTEAEETIHQTNSSTEITETTNMNKEDRNENNNEDKIKNCTNEEVLENKCTNGKINVNQINDIKSNLINSNYTKENTIIKTENVIIELSTFEDQKNLEDPEISNIDLGQCENKLKDANNISRNDSLIIFKTDIKTEDGSATYVVYEIYNPLTLAQLNLDVCKDIQITVNVPVKFEENLETLINSVIASGYNIFNENDSFYNDICATYTTENGTDILLYDRKQDIYKVSQNQSICQIGCELQSYNSTKKKAKCDCSVKQETITKFDINDLFEKKEIAQSFYKTLENSNFQVLKCYKLIINLSRILQNYGEIILSILLIIFIILMIIYFIKSQKKNLYQN